MFHEITICCIYDSSNLHDTTVTAGLMHITAPQMYMTPLSHSQLVWCISQHLKCTWHHCHTHSWSDAYHGSSNVHDTTVTAGLMHITAPQMYMTPLSHSQLVWCISRQLKCTWHHCHSWSDAYHSILCKLGQCAYTKWLGAFIALTVCCCSFDKGQECILKSLNLNHSLDNTPPPAPPLPPLHLWQILHA